MEKMDEFFAARAEGYDEHMLNEVEGCKEGYEKMAELIPESAESLLDLGCGTGLELEMIFEGFPEISVLGIDMTAEMLELCRKKFIGKKLSLICGDYFKTDFGINRFDAAVSFQTMHHFGKEMKEGLYRRVWEALKSGGVYIECDYMVESQAEEDHWFAESKRLRRKRNIPDGEFYHYDTPCTVENQLKLLKSAGFARTEKVFRIENTTIIIGYKEII